MTRRSSVAILVLALALAIQAKSAPAATIFFDNFDTENGGVGELNYNEFANWTVIEGTVDLIGNGFFDFFPDHGLYVDLDGSTNNAGTMVWTSSTTLEPGTYKVSFELAGNRRNAPDDTVTVSVAVVGTPYIETFTLSSSDPFAMFGGEFTVVAPLSVASLVFSHAGGDNIGILLDNVSIVTAPEPTTLMILGAGMIIAGAVARHHRRNA